MPFKTCRGLPYPNTLSIFRKISSAHCTDAAIILSVRGLPCGPPNRSSAVSRVARDDVPSHDCHRAFTAYDSEKYALSLWLFPLRNSHQNGFAGWRITTQKTSGFHPVHEYWVAGANDLTSRIFQLEAEDGVAIECSLRDSL